MLAGFLWLAASGLMASAASAPPPAKPEALTWQKSPERITADIQKWPLRQVLQKVAEKSGWRVYVEPGIDFEVSTRFKEVKTGEALRLLLGRLNYALVPVTNGPSRLLVFRTSRENATLMVRGNAEHGGRVPNELLVRLKTGAEIDQLAKKLGAKVTGRLDGQGRYRLEFEDDEATQAARKALSESSDVESVDDNYYVDRPPDPQQAFGTTIPPVSLQLRPPSGDGRVIVGLIDTGMQSLGGNLDQFILKSISVAGQSNPDPSAPAHGSSMAETILRSLQEITKGSTSVQILPVDVYGPNASTTTFDVAAGVVAAVNGGATVINLSLGSSSDAPFLKALMQEVVARDIIVFAAAGNEPVTTPFYPAAYPDVLAVTANDRGQIADYANRGSFVSLAAPGTSVVYFNGKPFYVVGTSAASAFASGIAAGYMETTKANLEKTTGFMKSNFGVQPVSSTPAK
jgi:hypothetical protein